MGCWPAVPSTVLALWSCRARAVSWDRPTAHALHWPSCRAGTGTVPAVPCGPWAVPKGRAACRASGPWAVWKSIVLGREEARNRASLRPQLEFVMHTPRIRGDELRCYRLVKS